MPENGQQWLLRELERFVEPLIAAADDIARDDLLAVLGWVLDLSTPDVSSKLTQAFTEVAEAAQKIASLVDPGPKSFEDLAEALKEVRQAFDTLSNLPAALTGLPTDLIDELPVRLLNYLTIRWLAGYHPFAYRTLALLTLLTPFDQSEQDPPLTVNGEVVRAAIRAASLQPGRIGELLSDPARTLLDFYVGSSGLGDAAHTREVADLLVPRLQLWLRTLGLDAQPALPLDDTGNPLAGVLSRQMLVVQTSGDAASAGLALALAGADQGNLGLVILPFGNITLDITGGTWLGNVAVTAAGGLAIGPEGLKLPAGMSGLSAAISLRRVPTGTGGAVLIGAASGTHLHIGQLNLSAEASLTTERLLFGGEIEVGQAALTVAAGDGDGFLARVLPPGGFETDFELTIGWSMQRGIYFRGGAGLEVSLPIHMTYLGILTLETVDLSILARADPEPGVTAVAAATVTLHIGPLTVSVERFGVEALLTFPNGGGNVGPGDLALRFQPPIGAALAIDAAVVSGGGYLRADHINGRYGGVLQLEIADVVNATAIGSLAVSPNRAHPDAPRNYSLLLIIVAEFPPIQLGFGFTLNGLGGIFGANRTMNLEALRAGVRTRALDSILFPQDAAADAVRILRDVELVFPPAPGRFVVGLMARFGWGSPRLITIDLGIIVELPSPVRIVLLGRMSLALPTPDKAVVELHLDVVGILDMGAKSFSIDATLYDSRVAAFTISGDMALRLSYGDVPGLIAAAGGLNPRFVPPPLPVPFPELRRLAISLGDGANPRIRLESYFATTPNSIQVGARLEIYVEVDLGILGLFSASAYLCFDALITLVPFLFVVDIGGGVEIRRNGAVLFGAELRLSLSGPQPVRAWGYAQFDFFGRHRIPFDHTFGPDALEFILAVTDPIGALLTALADPRNWEAQVPHAEPTSVALLELPPQPMGTVLVHPLGDISVRQRAVPLDVPIERFAGVPLPSGVSTLHVTVALGGKIAIGDPVREAFPTGESLELTDDEKLSREQFSNWPCGLTNIRLGNLRLTVGTSVGGVDGYETRLVDPVSRTVTAGPVGYAADEALLQGFLERGAAGVGPLRRTGVAAHVGPDLGIDAHPVRYRVVNQTDLTVVDLDGTGNTEYASESEALSALRQVGRRDLVVVGVHEGAVL